MTELYLMVSHNLKLFKVGISNDPQVRSTQVNVQYGTTFRPCISVEFNDRDKALGFERAIHSDLQKPVHGREIFNTYQIDFEKVIDKFIFLSKVFPVYEYEHMGRIAAIENYFSSQRGVRFSTDIAKNRYG